MAERGQRLLEAGHGLPIARARPPWRRPGAGTHRLVPQLAPQGVVGQPLDVLGQPVGVEPLDGLHDPRVQRAAPLVQQAAVGDLVGQRVLERVLELGEQAASRRGTRRPGGRPSPGCSASSGSSAMAWSSANGTSLPITAAAWSSRLSSGASRSMRAARTACTVAGTWSALRAAWPGGRRRARPTSAPVSTSARTLSSRKNGLPSVRSISSALERREARRRRRAARAAAPPRSRGGSGSSRSCGSRSCCPSRAGTPAGS